MSSLITDPQKDPLGQMLLDYHNGSRDAAVTVESQSVEMWEMAGRTMFRDYAEMDRSERLALEHCQGLVLDVGAGSGCHSLLLQENQIEVDAIDISPGCIEVMRYRGVKNATHQHVYGVEQNYHTILMLMNGFGLCGTRDGLNLFLQFARSLLEPGGQIIGDSTDLSLQEEGDISLHRDDESYLGETVFTMHYNETISDPFDWLYIDFELLAAIAHFNNYQCEQLTQTDNGHYLARLTKN